jgi:hypothetical protein
MVNGLDVIHVFLGSGYNGNYNESRRGLRKSFVIYDLA